MHKLSDYKNNFVLIYFYPKDDTPGCTKEACSIRDNFPSFKKLGITVFGISADSEKSLKKFEEKYKLPFHSFLILTILLPRSLVHGVRNLWDENMTESFEFLF